MPTRSVDKETGEIIEGRSLVPVMQTGLTADGEEVRRQTEIMLHQRGSHPSFPGDMTAAQAVAMARLTVAYKLDPFANELMLYQGRPYVTIDGRLRVANQHPMFDGIECSPASEADRQAYRVAEHEHLWIARVWRKDRRFPFVGYGRAAGSGDKNPVSKEHAQEMAQKRAKHRALRDAFSLPIPGIEETDDYEARYEASPVIENGESYPRIEELEPTPTGLGRDHYAAIHAKAKDLGWTDDEYREALSLFGVDSSADLTPGLAASFLELMEAFAADAEQKARATIPDEVVAQLQDEGARAGLTPFQLDFFALRHVGARAANLNAAAAQQLLALLKERQPAATEPEPEPPPAPEPEPEPEPEPPVPAHDQLLVRYTNAMREAARLGLDEAAYEATTGTPDDVLWAIVQQLERDITERKAQGSLPF